ANGEHPRHRSEVYQHRSEVYRCNRDKSFFHRLEFVRMASERKSYKWQRNFERGFRNCITWVAIHRGVGKGYLVEVGIGVV
ncbi:unnamed protein product, partial [Ilex paraguariensis]